MPVLPARSISTYLRNLWIGVDTDHATPERESALWEGERVARGWVEAGRAVDARRTLMGLSVKDLAKRSGVDPRTIADLIHARRESFTDVTLAGVERSLAWKRGSIMDIALEGNEPQDEEGLADIIAAWPTLSPELRAALVRIVNS